MSILIYWVDIYKPFKSEKLLPAGTIFLNFFINVSFPFFSYVFMLNFLDWYSTFLIFLLCFLSLSYCSISRWLLQFYLSKLLSSQKKSLPYYSVLILQLQNLFSSLRKLVTIFFTVFFLCIVFIFSQYCIFPPYF